MKAPNNSLQPWWYGGAGKLEEILSQHYAFREITEVVMFLIDRSKRPVLPNALKEKVSFNL